MYAKIVLKRISGESIEETELISFKFVKEAYTPYTTLNAKVYAQNKDYSDVCEVLLYVGLNLVHHGLVDSFNAARTNGKRILTIASRGFTSQLCQNQIEPGMIYSISINKLFDNYYSLPYVTHESSDNTSNYIYVKNHSTMWDGVANLAYKLTKMYPYIRGTNTVRITAEHMPKHVSYSDISIIESGTTYNYKRMVSHFNMADIEGKYSSHTLTDNDAIIRKIVRHNVLELDKQYLYDPSAALSYRTKFAKRGFIMHYCRYGGYTGEDLCDMVSFGELKHKRVCRIEITGNTEGIFTEIGVYYDGFYVNGLVK